MTQSPPAILPIHLETRDKDGAKLVSPSATRNSQIIGDKLDEILPKDARVLEIASGTGQHGAHMCMRRPDIFWQMSDYDETSRNSQNTYGLDFPKQMSPSLALDMTQVGWANNISPVDVIYCANMIHIAPWEAALGLAQGVQAVLNKGGALCLYGPFLLNSGSAPSNIQFDANLKARNPEWGVRNLEAVKHIFADAGLSECTVINMPRDNFFLLFT